MQRIIPQGAVTLLANFGNWPSPCYFRVFGPGNVRFAPTKQELEAQTQGGGPLDGIPQVQADGEKERFWSGDLWAVSDAGNTFVVWVAPQFEYSIGRGVVGPPDQV